MPQNIKMCGAKYSRFLLMVFINVSPNIVKIYIKEGIKLLNLKLRVVFACVSRYQPGQ
jgi:hypothetical protein